MLFNFVVKQRKTHNTKTGKYTLSSSKFSNRNRGTCGPVQTWRTCKFEPCHSQHVEQNNIQYAFRGNVTIYVLISCVRHGLVARLMKWNDDFLMLAVIMTSASIMVIDFAKVLHKNWILLLNHKSQLYIKYKLN